MFSDPLPTLRERKKAATKERLYFEALDLFRRQGFSATTIEEIAEAAEVSKGTFFNYFPSKEALLHYLSERLAQTTAEALAAALTTDHLPVRAQLTAFCRCWRPQWKPSASSPAWPCSNC
jgi:AcrR family transcriptional regulator